MTNHVKVYLKHFNFDESSFIPCEVEGCGKASVDIHHLIPRSKFGKKRKAEQDKITNLIALCRDHHNDAHNNKSFNQVLIYLVRTRKNNNKF